MGLKLEQTKIDGLNDSLNDAVRVALMDTHCKVYLHKAKAGLKERARKKLIELV